MLRDMGTFVPFSDLGITLDRGGTGLYSGMIVVCISGHFMDVVL